jgi:hypothetical protein
VPQHFEVIQQVPRPYAVPVHVAAQPQFVSAPLAAPALTASYAGQPMLLSQRPSAAGQTFAAPAFMMGSFYGTKQ